MGIGRLLKLQSPHPLSAEYLENVYKKSCQKVAKWSHIWCQNGPRISKIMSKLRQGGAKSTHWVPKASFASILLNFGRLWVTPVAQKEPIGAILGSILRPKWFTWRYQVQIMSSLGGHFGNQNVFKNRCKKQQRKSTKNDVTSSKKLLNFEAKPVQKQCSLW